MVDVRAKDIMYPKIQRHYSVFTMVKNKLTFRNAFSIIRVSLLVITELLAKDSIVSVFFCVLTISWLVIYSN